jgi:hypothetical protein
MHNKDKIIIGGLVLTIGAGIFEGNARHEHVPETFYRTTPVIQTEVPYITGSYVDMRTFQYDWGSRMPVSGSM